PDDLVGASPGPGKAVAVPARNIRNATHGFDIAIGQGRDEMVGAVASEPGMVRELGDRPDDEVQRVVAGR
ncbi:MAG: hypothetical protein ACK56I_04690, partial [bacterium]